MQIILGTHIGVTKVSEVLRSVTLIPSNHNRLQCKSMHFSQLAGVIVSALSPQARVGAS